MTQIEILEDAGRLREVVKSLIEASDEPAHPVLKESALYLFWGAYTLVLWDGKVPLSLHQTKIGKRKKNVWEPVANWYGAYTLPAYRRRGHAYRLYVEMEKEAVARGCRHVKSLAGSRAGLALHESLRHRCWGLTSNNEVFVYSPLPGHEGLYTEGAVPPQAPGKLMLGDEVRRAFNEGLRYDNP